MGSQFHHESRFRKPPSHPGRSDFPSPVGSHGCPRRIFPGGPRVKPSPTCAPRFRVISSTRSGRRKSRVFRHWVRPTSPLGSAMYREPLCASEALPRSQPCLARLQPALPGLHCSYRLMRQTSFLRTASVSLTVRSLRVAASPRRKLALPDVISTICRKLPGPLPRHVWLVLLSVASQPTPAQPYTREVWHVE